MFIKNRFIEKFQEKINKGEPASILIEDIEKDMDIHKNPLEAINTLFSITESLLKKILKNNKSCGKNILLYQRENRDTILNIQKIIRANKIRIETAHETLLRDIVKTNFTITTYIKVSVSIMSERVYNQYCPVARAMEVVGGRWTMLIIRELFSIELVDRFNDAEGVPFSIDQR